jgi:hypothetical protein
MATQPRTRMAPVTPSKAEVTSQEKQEEHRIRTYQSLGEMDDCYAHQD